MTLRSATGTAQRARPYRSGADRGRRIWPRYCVATVTSMGDASS
jgi:hypothetical protein